MRSVFSPRWWVSNWPLTVVYLCGMAVFVFTVNQVADLREHDLRAARARAEDIRTANVRFCQTSNERTAVLRDFVLPFTQPPDPRQYDFITDPVLRQGAIAQATRSRFELHQRVGAAFTQRDCELDFPPLPPPEK